MSVWLSYSKDAAGDGQARDPGPLARAPGKAAGFCFGAGILHLPSLAGRLLQKGLTEAASLTRPRVAHPQGDSWRTGPDNASRGLALVDFFQIH